MDFPQLTDPGYDPALLAHVDRLVAAMRTRAPAPPAAPSPAPPNGVFADIAQGLAKGFDVTAPTMIGGALKAPGQPGGTLYDIGQGLQDRAKTRDSYNVTGAFGEGAEALAAASPALAAGLVNPLLGAGAAAALFGGSQFQSTYEKGIAAGKTPDEIRPDAVEAGLVQGVGQAAGAFVGGRLLTGVAGRVLQRGSAQSVMDSFVAPSLTKSVAKGLVENAAVQVSVQAAAAAGVAAIEDNAGIKGGPGAWEAAKASVLPTLAMTALLAPFGAVATKLDNNRRQQLAVDVKTPPAADATPEIKEQALAIRVRAAQQMAAEMRKVDPTTATQWQQQALEAINLHEPVSLDIGFNAEQARAQRKAAAAQPEMPEAPSNAIDVQEHPAEEINIHTPEHYQSETIDVHPPDEPGGPGGGVGVEELHPEEINIHTPEHYQPQTINIHPPLQEEGSGGPKSGRGSQPTPEDVARQLLAAKEGSTAPGQGTALALGISPIGAIESASGKPSVTIESKIKALRGELGKAPIELVRGLAGEDVRTLPGALQAAWHDGGGEKAKAAYFQNIEALYKKLTGKDIRTVAAAPEEGSRLNRGAPNETPADINKGTESGTTGSPALSEIAPRSEQMVKAERDATANRAGSDGEEATGLTPTLRIGDTNALSGPNSLQENPIVSAVARFNGKEYDGPIHAVAVNKARADGQIIKIDRARGDSIELFRRKDGSVITKQEANKLAGNEVKSEDLPHGAAYKAATAEGASAPKRTEASVKKERAQKAATDNAVSVAAERVTLVEATGRELDGKINGMQQELRALTDNKDLSRDQYGRKQFLETEIGKLQKERADVTQAKSDAVAEHQDALDGKWEPAKDAGSHYYANEAWDTQQGLIPQLPKLRSYLVDKILLGKATAEERKLFKDGEALSGGGLALRKTQGNLTEAQAAWDRLSDADKAKYDRRVQDYARAVKLSVDMGRVAKEREAAGAVEEQATKAHLLEGLQIIDRNLKAGKITEAEALQQRVENMQKMRTLQERNDEMNRGVAGLSDKQLYAKLQTTPTAVAAMEHIARSHNNPIVRAVAKLLASANPNTHVIVVDNPTFDGGRYSPKLDQIEIGRGGMNPVTLMHETTHALVHKALGQALGDIHQTGLSAERQRGVDALKMIRGVMDRFREKADLTKPGERLALESEQEFVAEALNNPDIQQKLGGRAGLMTRVLDAVRHFLGISERSKSDFENLMHAATDLFGDPRRDSLEVFRSAINREGEGKLDVKNSPADAMESVRSAHEKLGAVGARLTASWARNDTSAKIVSEGLKFVTLNHTQWLFDHSVAAIRKQFTFEGHEALHGKLDTLDMAFRGWKRMVDERKSQGQSLINGRGESQDIMRDAFRLLRQDPAAVGRMGQTARDAKFIGVHPADKTLAEAQKRNPAVTKEIFNHSVAAKARAEYEKLSREHPEVAKLYDTMLQKHRLDFARYHATVLENTLKQFQMHGLPGVAERFGDLDWTKHREKPLAQQENDLNSTMRFVQGKIDDAHVAAKLQGENGKAFKDATLVKQAVDGMMKEYNRQSRTPYVHIGRTGDYHIGFDVADGPGNWERVGKVLGADIKDGGLHRDWHEQIGDNRSVYMKFGSTLELNEAMARVKSLREAGLFKVKDAEGNIKDTYFDGLVTDHKRMFDSATPEFIRVLKNRIEGSAEYSEKTKESLVRDLIDTHRQQLPETSPLKASMFADGDVGGSKDLLNTFRDRMTMSNQSLVNARASPRIADALSGMHKAMEQLGNESLGNHQLKLGRYVQELRGRAEEMQTPVYSPLVDKMKAMTAAWRLGMSPAYVAMTMYQPWQMTLPFVGARFGFIRTAASMTRNTGQAMGIMNALFREGWGQEKGNDFFTKASNLSDLQLRFKELENKDGTPMLQGETLDMLEHLQWSGLLNFGQAQQIFRTDPGDTSAAGKAARIATVMPHYAEMTNRMVGALTSFEMARALDKNGKETAQSMSIEKAREFAVQTIRNTDGDHSQANVARQLGRRGFAGKITPLLIGFQQYDFQMTELIARAAMTAFAKGPEGVQARWALAGVGVMTSAMAGTLGLPMLGLISAAANALGSLFGDSNDTPPDFEHAWREHMAGVFGEKGGEIVSRGLPRLLDFDMSARSGYQDLAPFSTFLADRRKWDDRLKDAALNAAGPAVGVLAGLATGAEAAYQGDYPKAINDALPAGVRNVAKAYRLGQYGYETQGGNNEIPVPFTNWNVLTQALGFVGAAKAEQSEKQFEWNTNQQLLQRRQQILRNAAYRAYEHGDYEAVGKTMQENIDFAVKHPQFHADVGAGLKSRAQERAIGSISGTGVLTNAHALPYLQRYFPGAPQ